jgi:hypothetical protein
MLQQISYQFNSAPEANRFLNELRHWPLHEVTAKLYKRSDSVAVKYEFDGRGFDYTCSDLDDLAQRYNGFEI